MNLQPYLEDHRVRFNSAAVGAGEQAAETARVIPRIYANGESKCVTDFCTIGALPDSGHRHDGFPIQGISRIPYDPLDDDSFLLGAWPVFRETRQINVETSVDIDPFTEIGGLPGFEDGVALINIHLLDPQADPGDRANFRARPADGSGARVDGWAEVPGVGVGTGEVITVNLSGSLLQVPFINGDPAEHLEPGKVYHFCTSTLSCGTACCGVGFQRNWQQIGFALSKRRMIFMPSHGGFEKARNLTVNAELFRTGSDLRIEGEVGFAIRESFGLLPTGTVGDRISSRTTPFSAPDGSKFPSGFSISVAFPSTITRDGTVNYAFDGWRVSGINSGWVPTEDNFTISPAGTRAIKVRQCMSDCFITAIYRET